MIAVVDYEVGNVGSVLNMLKKLGIASNLTRKAHDLKQSKALILPGVGSFDEGMLKLKKHELVDVLNDVVVGNSKPCLGICLGMQLMAEGSEEGSMAGLGWIRSKVIRFRRDPALPRLRVPHMGWNSVRPTHPVHPLFENLS